MARTAKAHARPVGNSRKRVSKIADAHDTLAEFDKGIEVDVATFGQFSIIDAIEAVLEKTGPAKVTLATWTAANFDLSQLEQQILRASITEFRMIVDASFVSLRPQFVKVVLDKFGKDSVRATRTHAKFCIIANDEWNVVIRTSMNLNFNPRLEYLQVTEDAALTEFWLKIADEIFAEEIPGIGSNRQVPNLEGIEGVQPTLPVRMGKEPRKGQLPRMGNRGSSKTLA